MAEKIKKQPLEFFKEVKERSLKIGRITDAKEQRTAILKFFHDMCDLIPKGE